MLSLNWFINDAYPKGSGSYRQQGKVPKDLVWFPHTLLHRIRAHAHRVYLCLHEPGVLMSWDGQSVRRRRVPDNRPMQIQYTAYEIVNTYTATHEAGLYCDN